MVNTFPSQYMLRFCAEALSGCHQSLSVAGAATVFDSDEAPLWKSVESILRNFLS